MPTVIYSPSALRDLAEIGYHIAKESVGNYVIYFCSAPDGLWVARVLHGARDHGPLL